MRHCALRLSPGESPAGHPRRAWLGAPRYRRTGSAESAKVNAPPLGSARWVRRGLLPQVVRMRAVRDAGGSLPVCHEGWFTNTPPGLARGSTPRCKHGRPHGRGHVPAGRWERPCRVRGVPLKPSCGDAGVAIYISFRIWVVRPKASLCCCESWRGRGCASGFMAATVRRKQFPLRCAHSSRDKFFSPPGAPLRCARKRCRQPVPRRPDHNKDAMGANLVQP